MKRINIRQNALYQMTISKMEPISMTQKIDDNLRVAIEPLWKF